MINCLICGKHFKSISQTHLKKHNLTSIEYKQQFPDACLFSQETKLAMGLGISRTKLGKPNLKLRGRKLSEIHKEKIKANHWAQKPAEETIALRARLAENGHKVMTLLQQDGRAYRFTTEISKAIWTEEHRKFMSSIIRGLKRSDETKQKISDNHWTRKSKQEVDNIIERIFLKDAQLKETEKGWYWSEKSQHEMFYMSSYEYRRFLFLENNPDVVWFSTRHPVRISYELNGTAHTYIPDILVKWKDGNETIEEIKGYIREQEKFEAKKEAAISWCEKENKKYMVFFEKDLENA